MLFKDIIGQEDIKSRLIDETKAGRVSHAQLFCGAPGIGKLPLAIAYARYLLCEHPGNNDACGVCHSCAMINKLAHPDLHFVFPVVKKALSDDYLKEWRQCLSKNPYFSFDDWLDYLDAKNAQPIIYARESDELIKRLSLKSFEGGYKVTIIWLPEKMNDEASNKLLKLIEEPPLKTIFLLVSDEPEKILPTILSRTQQITIQRVENTAISSMLKTRFLMSPAEADKIAHLSNGNVTAALKQAVNDENGDTDVFFDMFVNLMRLSYQRKVREMKLWSEQLAASGRERQKLFLEYSLRMIRESFIYNLHQPEMNYMTSGEEQFVSRFSPFVNERNVRGIATELDNALNDISRNVNSKIVFFDFSLKMIMLLKQ
jgi:DNA polymerase-3 subunit delta'